MTGTNHGLTGALIALSVKEPILAIPLSFISHFVCDMIPHFGMRDHPGEPDDELFSKKFNIVLILDFLTAVGLMVILGIVFPGQRWLIWLCMIAAAIPDLPSAYYRLYRERMKKLSPRYDPLYRFHRKIQRSQTAKGAYAEAVWFVLVSILILNFR